MTIEYVSVSDVDSVAQKVFPLMTDWVDMPKIKFLMKIADKSDYYGKCSRATGKWKTLTGYDYVIEVWNVFWQSASNEAKEALLFHELRHIQITEEEDGTIKYGIKRHDVEEFISVVEKYGLWSQSLLELDKAKGIHDARA